MRASGYPFPWNGSDIALSRFVVLSRVNGIANTDEAFGQDLSPQPPTMNQAAHNAMLCEVLQMLARLAETHAAH